MVEKHVKITTHSAAQTRKLGQMLGAGIQQPIIIALTGALGTGKTAFVQGLAKGLNVSKKYYITSPTFTLINEYPGRHPLFHVDLYRIEHLSELAEIGLNEILQEEAVVAIEWAEKLSLDTLSGRLELHLKISGVNSRHIDIFAYGQPSVNLLNTLEIPLQDTIKP